MTRYITIERKVRDLVLFYPALIIILLNMFVSAIFLLFVQIRTVRLSFAYRVLMYLHVTVMSQITPYGVGNTFNWISVHQSNQSIKTNTNNKAVTKINIFRNWMA